ncbi:MAG: CpaF/VirB11 family protein [Clostridiales bacterium]|nr:CpaF/VirB11 family protein [Clostridiales bacterium]
MRILNYALAALILAGVLIFLYRFMQSSDVDKRSDTGMLTIDKLSISQLVEITAKTLNSFLRQDFTSQNLTRQELENKNAAKARLRQALKDAAYGDREARAVIMEYIKSVITTNGALRVTENNIDEFVPFDDLNRLSSQDKFLMILQGYSRIYGVKALNRMFADLGFDQTNQVNTMMVNEACEILSDPVQCAESGLPAHILDFEFEDKLDYITHRIFESYKGFGVADSLIEMEVDEIDAGVSGLPTGSFDLTNDFVKSAKYAYESIWISLHGRNIHLSCLSFGSEDELERVCHNIYKYHATKVFSREQGYVVSSMKNGSRVVVTRPPFSDKYAFYVRKFDSSPSIEPENLIVGPGCEIPLILCKWFVKGQRNIAITGQQNTGKTTLLKSMIRWIDDLNIRTQELAFELNLSFSFPDKNISSFQETDSISAQEGLNLQKKTNGAVNIVGEVANAEQASHIIQTANIASLFAMFTYHAKTAQALVEMFALHLLQLGLYKEKRDAVEISAKTLNVDIHLENTKGYRHIDKISEIIPVETEEYPSELMQRAYLEGTGQQMEYTQEMALLDQREFYRRQTDRHLFDVNEICRWKNGSFELVHMPSEALITEIQSKLTDKNDEQEFLSDMERLRTLIENKKEAESVVLITQEG